MNRRTFLALMSAFSGACVLPGYAQVAAKAPRGKLRQGTYALPDNLAEYQRLSLILGRVGDQTATLSLLATEPIEALVEFGGKTQQFARQSKILPLLPNEPVEFVMDHLTKNAPNDYRVSYRRPGGAWTRRNPCTLRTQRSPGSSFTFTVQGDSHPERPQMSDPTLYAATLQQVTRDAPDFHICMGDDFSVDRLSSYETKDLREPYLLQRPFLGLVGQSASIFLINGNHEQASLFNYNQTDMRHNVAVGVQNLRNQFYPVPMPDSVYSVDPQTLKETGPLRDYCAWTWGDALFVILDNYWHSPAQVDSGLHEGPEKKSDQKHNRDWWGITLGDAQYQWFKRMLEQSHAKYKFVFAHHVLGTGRGGIEQSDLFEWGGHNRRGEYEFSQHRPGWELPVHQLMVKHKVNIFFQGHDHLFVRQERDGIVYQEVPMPADQEYSTYNADRYTSGVKLPNSGYLRVKVSPEQTQVEYVRTFLPQNENAQQKTGSIAHSYAVRPGGLRA